METVAAITREEELRYPCEVCHTGNGENFTDRRWACRDCARKILERLVTESLRLVPGARRRRA